MINTFKLNGKTWFFDIDDTLIDTAGTSKDATSGISKVFEGNFDLETAEKVTEEFNNIFDLMLAGYRVKEDKDWQQVPGGKESFERLLERIGSCQIQIEKNFGQVKKWSREVFIKLAAENVGVAITPELIHEAADGYWMTLTEQTEVFEGAQKLFTYLHETKQPVFLITSSDARLKMQTDGQFIYDPGYSESLKRERIELLRNRGLDFRLVSIGDPEDKPNREFFEKGISMAQANLGHELNLNECVMVGDSYGGDLETPHKVLGFGLVVLFVKGQEVLKEEGERFISTGDLRDLIEKGIIR